MIRLTLNPHSKPEIHLFNKAAVLIGSESAKADLVLLGKRIEPLHLKIMEQEGTFIALNIANDPFVALNDYPFGRKSLHNGDILTIQDTQIRFEALLEKPSSENSTSSPTQEFPNQIESNSSNPLTPNSQESHSFLKLSFPFEQEVRLFKEEELKDLCVDRLFKEAERHITPPPAQPAKKPIIQTASPSSSTSVDRSKIPHLKDDYLKEFDDDNQTSKLFQKTNETVPSFLHTWRWIILFLLSVAAIASIIGTVIYLSVSDRTEAQEIKASQGVADVAMALVYAQAHQLKPTNQNWSDVEFLKQNLQAILPNSYSYASELDAQGQFNCCPYSLRIYTSRDLSRFLLIAQPAPSLLQWLIPKSVILVDSQSMELRVVKDVRTLNRLLANSDPLEGLNGREISSLIKQGELVRLSQLASESNNLDFAPPKNLGWIKPGVENFIYNAPRYYRFAQPLLQKAIQLTKNGGSSQEVTSLKQETEIFSHFPYLVLYSAEGKKGSQLAKQGLSTFASNDKFLFGYLSFTPQGTIHQNYMLKEDEDVAALGSLPKERNLFPPPSPTPLPFTENGAKSNPKPVSEDTIDTNHPIYIQLSALTQHREQNLKSLMNALVYQLNQEIEAPESHFPAKFQDLATQYLIQDAKYQIQLKKTLKTLYAQYDDLPLTEFMAYIKALHLEHLIQQDHPAFALVDENCQQNMETLFTHIDLCKNISELNYIVEITCSWLNLDYVPDPEVLQKLLTKLRNKVLNRLEQLLLSSKERLSREELTLEEQTGLQHILSHEKIIHPEERQYFLDEFKRFLASPPALEHSYNFHN